MNCFLNFLSFWLLLGGCHLSKADLYTEYEERLDIFIEGTLKKPGCDISRDILRIHFDDQEHFCEDGIKKEIDRINGRGDGIDFSLASLGWIFWHYWDSPLLTTELKTGLVEAVTTVPLFYSEEGYLGPMQYWSENHQVGWYAAEYLIGSAFAHRPELAGLIFTASGVNGSVHQERGGERLRRWMRYRLKYGFSEFNSDTYGPIAYRAVAAAAGCSPDPETRDLSRMVMNLQLYDHIVGSKGVKIVTPQGRSYGGGKMEGGRYTHLWLIKGEGNANDIENEFGSAQGLHFSLAVLHGYKLPSVLLEVAADLRIGTFEMKERFGLGEYEEDGVGGDDADECTFWFGNGGYFSPVHPRCLFIVGDEYNLWNRSDTWMDIAVAKPLWDLSPDIIDIAGVIGAPLGHGAVLGPGNVQTFRSPDIFLSSFQDYKGGYMAGQQHAWQATLDIYRHGMVFTTQPTTDNWVGGILPKVGQVGTTLLALYSPEVLTTLAFSVNMTHAHFRKADYDEYEETEDIGEGSRWFIGRQGDAYVALYSWKATYFIEEEDGTVKELVAPGVQNVWICEVGSAALNGSFDTFQETIVGTSEVEVNINWDNSLVECLVDNGCLAGILDFIDCMTGICSSFKEGNDDTTECLNTIHRELDLAHDQEQWVQLVGSCLADVKKSDIDVTYRMNGSVITYGWAAPLVIDGQVIKTDSFPRYENQFTSMEWGQRNVSIEAGGKQLYMEFDNGVIEQN